MQWNWSDIIKMLLGGGLITSVFMVIAKKMDWIRFKSKDQADKEKTTSEAVVNLATANAKKIKDEINLSRATMDWAIEMRVQLNEETKRKVIMQNEIDRLHGVIDKMRTDFEARIKELEDTLDAAQDKLNAEKIKNAELLEKLNKYINAGNPK